MTPELEGALRVGVAALGGAAVGVERQWSGHATGPHARLAGIRTFTLLGALAGLAGWFHAGGATLLAALLVAGAAAVVALGYRAASRAHVDATTEVAALVVLAAGAAAGMGHLAVASGTVAVTWLLLVEKRRLHALVRRLGAVELRAAARFTVMAVVVLPLLPEGPIGPFGGVRPRALWMLVLLFSGLGFAGWVARRAVGPGRGTALAGLLGGLVSSTAVTAAFARASHLTPGLGPSLAAGVTAAAAVMFFRMVAVTALLAPDLAAAAAPLLLLPGVVCAAVAAVRALRDHATTAAPDGPANPLQVANAVAMALLFQAVLWAVRGAQALFGTVGLVASGPLLGLADVDGLVLAMATTVQGGVAPDAGPVLALALGALANTLLKLVLGALLGTGAFRRRVLLDLGVVSAAAAVAIALHVA